MNENAQHLAESKYRRGTILGLTVAEIFILLLFLLMLVFVVVWQELEAQQQGQQEVIEQLQRALDPLQEFSERWEAPLAGIETPSELRNLREFNETWEKSLEGIERPDEIYTLKELREDVKRSQGDAGEGLFRDLVEAGRAMREAEEDNKRLQEELVQATQGHEEAEERVTQLSNELRVLNKGQNPPCWYDVVPDGAGGMREKGLYAFDVGVFDEHMVIRRRDPPPGGAFDDGDSTYADEWGGLGLADVRYDVPLSNNELTAELQRIHDFGKQGEVRNYPCIFSVRVWDETSPGAKERWQRAHDRTLEWLFGTFRVEGEPWETSR